MIPRDGLASPPPSNTDYIPRGTLVSFLLSSGKIDIPKGFRLYGTEAYPAWPSGNPYRPERRMVTLEKL